MAAQVVPIEREWLALSSRDLVDAHELPQPDRELLAEANGNGDCLVEHLAPLIADPGLTLVRKLLPRVGCARSAPRSPRPRPHPLR
jgi:hypothetical protein